MSSIPNQDHPAAVPLVELDPFNRPNDELFITLQGSEIRRSRLAKSSKAASEAQSEGISAVRFIMSPFGFSPPTNEPAYR